jgi:DNA-binding HxlR family transcriptional regulator
MEWTSVDLADCPVIGALDVVGKPWTLVVLREAFNGVRRYEDFQQHLRLSRSVLSRRLTEMVSDGLLSRVPYQDAGTRTRHEYLPTDKALALYPVLVGLMHWGERYVTGSSQARLLDRRTGQPLVTALVPAGTPSCPPAQVEVRVDAPGEPT